jgi:hypothetical protein
MQESRQEDQSPFGLLPRFPGSESPGGGSPRHPEETRLVEEIMLIVVTFLLALWLIYVLGAFHWSFPSL